MTLQPGARVGAYDILDLLGAGGMGEVYRARDTRLGRDVALKVLPEQFVSDSERIARLRREAQMLAALNHPHIGGIHGLEEAKGVTALVLELVEGPTLADRIAQGPIPIDEALAIARQIAEALEAAHDRGIVHRDLKPANIKLRPDDTVKVLDFGLAKAGTAADIATAAVSESPTITTPAATHLGMILGTAAYMSPEQARGKAIDKRTDIWSFGCVLYEMLTGRRAFSGDDVSDVMASILAREPDAAALPAALPPSIRRLLRRCLAKDRHERLRDIGDARIEIREALANIDSQDVIVSQPGTDRRSRRRMVAGGALALLALMVFGVMVWISRPTPSASEVRLEITTPPTPVPASMAISPDGRMIVFVATTPERQSRLWLRQLALDSSAARPLAGTDAAHNPFWSPDSRSIGFFADNRLKRIDIDGGSVRAIANVFRGTGGTWSREGVILFSSLGDPISRIPDTGGEPRELWGLVQQGSNFSPHFLPDGRHFLYYVRGTPDARGVYVGRLDGTSEPRRLFESDAGAVYASSGHLLFVRNRTLLAQPFDPIRLELKGNPFPVSTACACPGLSVSRTGSIAYRATAPGIQRSFAWFDRAGRQIAKVVESGGMSTPALSRDGQRVVGYRGNPADGNVDVWLLDPRRGTFTRLTSDVADDVTPAWSPDGQRIVFSSNRKGTHDLYVKPASPGGREELLLATDQEKTGADWSPDGRFVVFESRDMKRRSDLWAVPVDGTGKPFPVSQTDFEEMRAQFSPVGNWIAYQSDESGRHEIYVQPFPGPGNKVPISTSGGSQVRWRRDGKELFYVALDGRLMAVPIRLGSHAQPPDVGTPVALFAPPLGGQMQQGDFRHQYVVSPDGQQFLIGTVTEGINSPITVILNWQPATSR